MAVNLKRSSGEDSNGGKTSRRKMLGWLTGAGLFGSAGLSAVSNFVFIKPRATYGQPQRFSVGKPEDYPSGARAILAPRGICIIREGSKLAAISITCTHLGCTVGAADTGFACPCNGEIEVDKDIEVTPGSYLTL